MHELVWYYAATGPGGEPERKGPISERQLRDLIAAGKIRHATLVWAHGMMDWKPVREIAALAGDLPPAPPTSEDDVPYTRPTQRRGGSAWIPSDNPLAVAAYYAAILGLIPMLMIPGSGILIGPATLAMGILGLIKYRRDPAIRGRTHSWVGIIMGGLVTLLHVGVGVALLIAYLNRP